MHTQQVEGEVGEDGEGKTVMGTVLLVDGRIGPWASLSNFVFILKV